MKADGEIRTHDVGIPVYKTGAIDHYATSAWSLREDSNFHETGLQSAA